MKEVLNQVSLLLQRHQENTEGNCTKCIALGFDGQPHPVQYPCDVVALAQLIESYL